MYHIFTAGDMRKRSLIVWAISEGREAAREVDHYLMGYTNLPTKGNGDLQSITKIKQKMAVRISF
jgi:glutamate synthase (NADPH/NADH) small chain